ncbi:MSMEG_0565 family glycosyltransferase [Ancylobacter sp. Lp-2]|uniref:MSMEG_0565 family glycosyltransferase n=1 Tax=Ancylobacter sp. Lp-2 TaxID=2881339 RepID=UPI001E622FCD|nr:MSMEG_0565 family glycosyltransferase [Ancylobacter sp. Lp-2]MCB4768010.1 MSMEG_0565 family glycosyltransferase [Ancylobacter sp. Lp-2]
MAASLRIAVLSHSTNPRGGVVHAMQLCEALADLGHRPVLHAPDAKGTGFFRTPRCEAVAFEVGPAPAGMTEMVEQRIADYVAHFEAAGTEGFDLFHAHDGISGNALATLKARGRIPGFVRTVHHIDAFADPRLAALQERAIRAADGWLTVSRLWQAHLAEVYGLAADLSGNGVDGARFRPQPDGGEGALRARLGLGAGPILLAVGGIEARKNTLRILDAFLQLRALHPKAELVVAGGASLLDHGAYQAEFRAMLALHGAHGVHVTGPLADADMARLYRIADALVFASVKEGFGLCVLEAMACGVPVVVSRIAPFTEYLADDEAIWCDPQRPAAIADAMALALRPGSRATFAPRGLAVAARHDWTRVARAHLPLYTRLAETAHA